MADYVDPNPNIAECSRKHRDYIKLVKPEINAAVGLLQSLEENEQDRFDLVMDEVSYTYPEDPIPRPKFNSGIFNRRLEHYDRQIFANRRYLRQTMRSVLEILEPMLSDEGHGSRDGVADGGDRGSQSGETESHVWVCSLSHGEVVWDK